MNRPAHCPFRTRPERRLWPALFLWASLVFLPRLLLAQQAKPAPAPGTDSVSVAAGAKYEAGGLHRFLFGGKYRNLWKASIRAPVLNLATFAGGLTPEKAGGGAQTKSLRLTGADGREYVFRSVDKDNVQLADKFRGTVVEKVARDQVSSSHPGAALVAAPLLEAAGILHPTPHFFVMPDDERLGEFRKDFAGRLGLLEEFPDKPKNRAGFAGASDIIDSEDLLKLINQDPANQVDVRAFAAARLMDMFLNDWDRHPGQWKWAQFGQGTAWIPVPRDRDKAFIWYSGLIHSLARIAAPNLTPFKDSYPSIRGLTFNSVEFDRRMLAGLERPVWDSIARDLVGRLSDSVVDAAVLALPPEYRISAPELARTLKARRDGLPDVANRFCQFLAGVVDIHATDAADRLSVIRVNEDTVRVELAGQSGSAYFSRRFIRQDTDELRIYLHGGDDRALVRGDVAASIPLRIVGGNGNNSLVDSSRVGGDTHQAHLYDQGRVNGISYGPDSMFNRRPWIRERGKRVPPGRDRGSQIGPILGFAFDDDFGFVPRVGLSYAKYGFGRRPYLRRIALTGEYASRLSGGRLEMAVDQRRENSPLHFVAAARVSELEVIRFHGFGNLTPGGDAGDFYDVGMRQWTFQPAAAWSLGPRSDLYLGPVFQYTVTDSTPNRFISEAQPYGVGDFGEAGLRLALHYDVRDQPKHPRSGVLVDLNASYFPAVWDVKDGFGAFQGSVAAYLTFPVPLHPILALRLGGKKVVGDFPYFEAAFLGGGASIRNLEFDRFAGDASLNGAAELRLPVANFSFILPFDVGVFGLVDAGRVYLHGASPGGWHTAVGGGFWIGLLDPSTALSFAFTNGQERTGAFVKLGLAF